MEYSVVIWVVFSGLVVFNLSFGPYIFISLMKVEVYYWK